jgi:hypothetical protein
MSPAAAAAQQATVVPVSVASEAVAEQQLWVQQILAVAVAGQRLVLAEQLAVLVLL